MPKENEKQPQSKNEKSSLNKVDRGFLFMMANPKITEKEEKTNFKLKSAKMISFFGKEIHLSFEFTIKPKVRKC